MQNHLYAQMTGIDLFLWPSTYKPMPPFSQDIKTSNP